MKVFGKRKKPAARKRTSMKFWVVLVVIVLVAGVLSYLGYGVYNENKLEREKMLYNVGYNQGITAATVALYQQTDTCQPVTIFIGDQQKQVIDIRCLQG